MPPMTVTESSPRQGYHERLRTLSEASVHQHFDAFLDIDWDHPDYAIRTDDERWILGEEDPLGAHPWYRALPRERQIEIGIKRWALICKVGLQFEQLLIGGIMWDNLKRPNGNPEFRYSTHEATEECHHTQMFQEFANRSGVDPSGVPAWFRRAIPLLATFGYWFPAGFWMGVLAGEEPIDHLQKGLLRAGRELPPLLERIVSIHVAEEARHIGFAHTYLAEHIGELPLVQKVAMHALTPLFMRLMCDIIMKPSREAVAAMGIPERVAREVWWDSPASERFLRHIFGDVRMLCDGLGLRTRLTRPLWRLMGIEGRPSRFRSEPAAASS
jgi:hypothetical protein